MKFVISSPSITLRRTSITYAHGRCPPPRQMRTPRDEMGTAFRRAERVFVGFTLPDIVILMTDVSVVGRTWSEAEWTATGGVL